MADALLLAAAQLCSASGMGWLALTKKEHWQQVRGNMPLDSDTRRALRWLGSTAFVAALVLCAVADHVSMAGLVWVMELSASALLVAFMLSWRPSWLLWLVPWVKGEGATACTRAAKK